MASSPLELAARRYLQGSIQIHRIVLFEKYASQCRDSYPTTEAAFLFPISGTCEISFSGITFHARPGTVIHGCPGKQISFRVTSEEPFRYINLYYCTREQLLFEFQPAAYPQILAYLHTWLSCQDTPEKCAAMIGSLRRRVFGLLFAPYLTPEAGTERELIQEVETYIQDHYMLELSLDLLAETFDKTRNQLSYLFYKHKHIRPIDYLISYRLSVAGHLLTTTNLSITEISQAVGYRDNLFFSRLFKKHYGCSPRAFRSIYR